MRIIIAPKKYLYTALPLQKRAEKKMIIICVSFEKILRKPLKKYFTLFCDVTWFACTTVILMRYVSSLFNKIFKLLVILFIMNLYARYDITKKASYWIWNRAWTICRHDFFKTGNIRPGKIKKTFFCFLNFQKEYGNYGRLLTLSWRIALWYRNQSINLLCKLIDWFLYVRFLRHERVE